MSVSVLARFDDVGLLFVDKPCGILVHNSAWAGPREHTLVDDVRAVVGNEVWHPLHRLDRQTSGVVAFARADVVPRFGALFARSDDAEDGHGAEHVVKIYWALVRGRVAGAIEIVHALKDDDTGVVRGARSRVAPLLVSNVDRCSLVEVQLFSGRKHQARRHLKHIAHPVIGDANHGKGAINRAYRAAYGLGRMALHARSLAIVDDDAARTTGEASTRAIYRADAPVPDDLAAPLRVLFRDQRDALDRLLAR